MSVDRKQSGVTRRDFVRIAVGSLVTLPSVAGGFIVPVRSAYAETGGETNAGSADDGTTKITLVFAAEVGFYVADVSEVETKPVAGARVKVTSRYNDKSVEGTTGKDGIVKLDIRNLAENYDNENVDNLSEYAFNATIAVTRSGYREFECKLTRVHGGEGLLVPSRPLTDGLPYPKSVSFNEWDALYTENEFLSTPANTESHEFSMEWRQMPSNAATTVRIKDRETGEVLQQKTARPSGGTLKTSFSKPFLRKGGTDELPTDTSFDVELEQGNTRYLVPINLVTREGVAEDSKEESDVAMEPLDYGMTSIGVDWPLDVPILGGGAVQSFSPSCYANFSFNPWGYMQVTLKTPSWGYYNDTDPESTLKKGWGTRPQSCVQDQWNRMMNTAAKNLESTQSAYDSAYAIPKIDTFGMIRCMANMQLIALAKWDNAKRQMQGNAALQLFVGVSANYTWNYLVGPFPILITLGLDSSLVFSVSCGFYSIMDEHDRSDMIVALFRPKTWKWDYTNTGFTITFNFIPSLSVGLGVNGVASVSVKGAVTISYVTAWDWKGKGNQKNKPRPHIITGYAVSITLVIHALLCTATFKIKQYPFHTFYDNWEGHYNTQAQGLGPQSEEEKLRAMAETGITAPLRQVRLITSDKLEELVEFDLDDLDFQAQSDDEAETFDWAQQRMDDAEGALDDGKVIHYAVYSLRTKEVPDARDASQDTDGEDRTDGARGTGVAVQSDADGTDDGAGGDIEADGLPRDADGDVRVEATGESDQQIAGGVASQEKSGTEDGVGAEGLASPARPKRQRRNMRSLSYTPRHARRRGLGTQAYDPNTGSALPDPKPLKLGVRGGIRPESDMMINQPGEYVYGDPRFKVVDLRTYAGETRIHATCVFRIGIVSVGGEPRSRLILTILSAGVESGATGKVDLGDYVGISKVIDFEIDDVDVDHRELYDYDFDIALTSSGDSDIVRIVIVSGARAQGDNTPVANMICDLYFTYLDFEANGLFGRFDYEDKMSMKGSETFQADDDGLYHSISNIKLSTDGTFESPTLLVAYLDRICDSPDVALEDDTDEVLTKVCFMLVDCVDNNLVVPERQEIDRSLQPLRDAAIHDLVLLPPTTVYSEGGDRLGQAYTVTLTSLMNETFFYVLRLGMNREGTPVFTSMKEASVLESSMHLVWWPNHDSFLTSYPRAEYLEEIDANGLWTNPLAWDRSQWVLQKCWWVEEQDDPRDPELTTPVLRFEQIGPDAFAFSNFGINSAGSFVFWPQTRDADDGEYGSNRVFEGDGSYTDEEEPAVHQLMACRINFEKFSDPFIVADVDHEMNTLQVVRTNDRYAPLEVLSSELVDTGDTDDDGNTVYHASNIYYTAIPNTRCATATGCTSPLPLVAPGGTITFHVTVRNDGNCYLSGCTLQLCLHDNRVTDEEGNVVSEDVSEVEGSLAEVTFGEDTLVESCWNPKEGDGLKNVEPDWSLAPGKRGVYKVDIKIPDEWGADGQDEKWVSFVARKPIMAEGGGLVAQEDGDEAPVFQDLEIEPGTFRPYHEQYTPDTDREQTHMQVIQISEAVAEGTDTVDAPVTYATGDAAVEPAPYSPGARVPESPRDYDGRYDWLGVNSQDTGLFGPLGSNGSFRPQGPTGRVYTQGTTGDTWTSGTTGTQGSGGSAGTQGSAGASTSAGLAAGAPGAVAGTVANGVTDATGAMAGSPTAGEATGAVPGAATSTGAGRTSVTRSVLGSTGADGQADVSATGATASAPVPGTADVTDAVLPVAAALAGVAAVAAGAALTDEGDE